jgi:Uma2 family endonuclease
MVAALAVPKKIIAHDQRFLVSNVRWRDYIILREALDTPGLRMTYLDGELELMTPSRAHESNKKVIARLIETYAFLKRLPLNGYGSTTFRSEAKQRGVEPDECWMIGAQLEEGDFPQIVLEVIESNPLIDKLAVYRGLGVSEVWLFEEGAFTIYVRNKVSYAIARSSRLLPDLDFGLIAELVREPDQQTALETLERKLKRPSKRRSRS